MENIEEMIADARAEEEVKKAQAKRREEIKEKAKERVRENWNAEREKISIDREEYKALILEHADYLRVIEAIRANVRYNKYSETLGINDEFMDIIKALYPDLYNGLKEEFKEDLKEGE